MARVNTTLGSTGAAYNQGYDGRAASARQGVASCETHAAGEMLTGGRTHPPPQRASSANTAAGSSRAKRRARITATTVRTASGRGTWT